jgi:hypothetical protein
LEEYKKIEEFQNRFRVFRCLMGKRNGLDHNHSTGEVRGILDWRVNRALGLIESIKEYRPQEILSALVYFLDNPPATSALERTPFGLIGKAQKKKVMVYGPPND